MATSTSAPSTAPQGFGSSRQFGRYQLRGLLGRSSLTMAWLAHDERLKADVMLMLPRTAPADPAALKRWTEEARRASRLQHPGLLPVLEVGQDERWPYVACERVGGVITLAEHLAQRPALTPLDVAGWSIELLDGLASAHDAGVAHGDLGLHALWINAHGHVGAWGLAVAVHDTRGGATVDPQALRDQRAAGDRDTLAAGLLLYQFLAGAPALDEPDLPSAARRSALEIVRLPWALPQPVPEALRAIVNRATDRHQSRRYLGARSLQRALEGWRKAQSEDRGGPLALLVDRLSSVGHLPARPGLTPRLNQLSRMEKQRMDELTDLILQDPALSFELLRMVNAASYGQREDEGVATVRRAVQLVGLDGVRRAASALRAWPGPLDERGAQGLQAGMRQAFVAGQLAAILAPGGLDEEGSLITAQLQHLGRLLALYHFPDEASQIAQLMKASPPAEPGGAPVPGLPEAGAAMAVLGVDLESLAAAVARHWGLDETVQVMMRPLPLDQPVRAPESVDGWMRLVASCANEVLQVALQPPAQQIRALQAVAARYHKALGVTVETLKDAFTKARQRVNDRMAVDKAPGPMA